MWQMLQQPTGDDYVVATNTDLSVKDFVEMSFQHVNLNWEDYGEFKGQNTFSNQDNGDFGFGQGGPYAARPAFDDLIQAATEAYPFNPNGSPEGLTAVTTADGRFTAMMPHPERVFRNIQMSWTSGDRSQLSPWMRIWRNARQWVG